MPNRWASDPEFKLRDNNLVSMVAGHWQCSSKTVWTMMRTGRLKYNVIGGAVRITRAQVLECEAAAQVEKFNAKAAGLEPQADC